MFSLKKFHLIGLTLLFLLTLSRHYVNFLYRLTTVSWVTYEKNSKTTTQQTKMETPTLLIEFWVMNVNPDT